MLLHTRRRRGMTLRDLIVLVFVVGVLFALLVPALNDSRDGCGRRAQCQSNLHNLGLGLTEYITIHGSYPNAGTIFDHPDDHGGDPTQSNLYLSITDPGSLAGQRNPWLRNWVVDLLPYIDEIDIANAWDKNQVYFSTTSRMAGQPPNGIISSTSVPLLRCPDDPTAPPNQGILSYVVNGGFARWPALPVGWSGGKADGQPKNGAVLHWVSAERPWQENQAFGRRTGVMFLGTHTGDQPWDIKTTSADITDGLSTTLLLGENTLAGFSKGTPYSGGLPTNWACPLPNFTMFLGSDDVCRSTRSDGDCLGGQLRPPLGAGWARANQSGTFEDINYGQKLTVEGSFPFANSGHPGGANFAMCDGSAKFISSRIDGSVYAKLITPAGSRLPEEVRQTPLSAGE